jgi:hypothetical protein
LGQCLAYCGDERIGIASSDEPLIREINRRGIQDDGFDLFVIRPQGRESEEVTYPSSWRSESTNTIPALAGWRPQTARRR